MESQSENEKIQNEMNNSENLIKENQNSNGIQDEKELTIEHENNGEKVSSFPKVPSTRDIRDDVSEVDSSILRPKSERRPVSSTFLSPYGGLIRSNSNQDFRNSGYKNRTKISDGMLLQLVIPGNSPTSSTFDNNYLTGTSYNDKGLGNGNLRDRHKHQTYSINSHQEDPGQFNGGHINHGYSPYDLTEYRIPQSGSSIPNTPALSTHKPDNPTPPEEKKMAFSKTLVNTFSIFYALFIVTVGLAVYVADIIDASYPIAEYFSVFLVIQACLYLLILTIDISIFMSKKQKYEKKLESSLPDNVDITETPDGNYQFNIVLPEVWKMGKSIRHDYCFNKDRHSTNFYLKVGAAAFCFGHLIHNGLLLTYHIIFFTSENHEFNECTSIPLIILDFIYPFYSFLLLFFIFKYSNVIINRNTTLARFGIMHCLSSSICFWIWTIMREVLEAIASKNAYYNYNTTATTDNPDVFSQSRTMITKNVSRVPSILITVRRFTAVCEYEENSITSVFRDISPYLYPFSVEFSILVVGVLFLVWDNIGKCNAKDETEASTSECKNPSGNTDNMESNIVLHADCQASNKGLFGGFIVLILTVVTTIFFFVSVYIEGGSIETGRSVHKITSIIIVGVSLLACLLGYWRITKLDLNSAHHNLMDDILLFMCIPAFFLNGVFSILPAIIYNNGVSIVDIILEVVQVLVQTAFILDGLRRSSNTKKLRKSKPGRELVTFLVIANVAMWLNETFSVKDHALKDDRYEFYGTELWTILGHVCLPLIMFYRFHSSVCFGDIWKYAYEPSGH